MNKRLVIIISVAITIILAVIMWRGLLSLLIFNKKTISSTPISGNVLENTPFLKDARELIKEGKTAEAIKFLETKVSSKAGTKEAAASILALAQIYKDNGNLLEAKKYYSILLKEYSAFCNFLDLQNKMSSLNMAILFSPTPTADSQIYVVKTGDTLESISKKYKTTTELIKIANRVNTDNIKVGMKLKVQTAPFSIIIDKSQSNLTLLLNNEAIKTYTVSTGKNNSTPNGKFQIKNKLVNPVWYSPNNKIVVAGSPDNALGSRWMGFCIAKPDYGIHGTNDPKSIGYQCTEGCIRMLNPDVEELYAIIPIDTEVTIMD